jgi:hypothetical protein
MNPKNAKPGPRALACEELEQIHGGMWRIGSQIVRNSTRMGDGTVEGQPWYKERQAAEAKARTDAAVAHARATIPDFDKIVSPSPFAPRGAGAGLQIPPHAGHPQLRKGN